MKASPMGRFGLLVLGPVLSLPSIGCSAIIERVVVRAPNHGVAAMDGEEPLPDESPPGSSSRAIRVEVGPPAASLSLWVLEPRGTGPVGGRPPRGTILLLHGWRKQKAGTLRLAEVLTGDGYRAVAVDLRGHGRSTGDWMSYGAIEARDLSQVLDALEARGLVAGPIGVFGISYGAAVGIQFAARDRRVRAVVAVASFSSLRSVIPRYVRLFFPVRGWFMSEGQIQAAIDRAAERAGFDPDGADVGEAMAFGGFGKPFAMVETNDAAERLPLPGLKVVIEGSPSRQLAYHQKLLVLAQEQKFRFVISFIHQDYDALWEKIKGSSPELFMAWRDCGLLDERGRPRPALETWKGYFTLELEE